MADMYAKCNGVAVIAKKIMEARQANVPMREMVDIGKGIPFDLLMIKDAYKRPRFTTKAYQKNAVQDFENEYYGYCIENESKKKK